jgi:hypothetical protein
VAESSNTPVQMKEKPSVRQGIDSIAKKYYEILNENLPQQNSQISKNDSELRLTPMYTASQEDKNESYQIVDDS